MFVPFQFPFQLVPIDDDVVAMFRFVWFQSMTTVVLRADEDDVRFDDSYRWFQSMTTVDLRADEDLRFDVSYRWFHSITTVVLRADEDDVRCDIRFVWTGRR